MDKKMLICMVNNDPGVLIRLLSLFSRRCYNILELSVGDSEKKHISRVTIITCADDSRIKQMISQISKLRDVQSVYEIPKGQEIITAVALVKIKPNNDNKKEVSKLVQNNCCEVVDISDDCIIVRVDGGEKLDKFLKYFDSKDILEIARTGSIALLR